MVASIPCFSIYEIINKVRNVFFIAKIILQCFILVYGIREGSLLSCRGFWLFHDLLIGDRDGGGLSTTLSAGLRCGGLESKFGRHLDPLIGE